MLIQFVVENFRSFRDKTVFSMRAAGNVDRAPDAPDVARDGNILRCAALYGANASGKSNFVKALRFARDLVVEGVAERGRIRTQPFRLEPSLADAPSRFELHVRAASGKIYGYGFTVRADAVLEEWLVEVDGEGEREIFSRRGNDFAFADAMDSVTRDFLHLVSSATRDNQLLLRTTREFKRERFPQALQDVTFWFEYLLVVIEPDAKYHGLVRAADADPNFRAFLSEVLARADTGIASVSTERRELRESEAGELLERIAANPDLQLGPGRAEYLNEGGEVVQLELRLHHPGSADRGGAEFGLEDESDGTVRLLDLAPMLFHGPQTARIFVVDEIDRSMHTALTRWLVERFIADAPGSASQLIFTTHDTNLLDVEALLPDTIWFAEKDERGASSLYSLAEFKKEQLEQLRGALEQGYLNGRFGAIPFLPVQVRLGKPRAGGG